MVKKLTKKKKKKLTKEQLIERKKRSNFSKQISDIFIFAGFDSLNVNGFQFELGGRSNELDHCFLYENVMIICEDTIREIQKKEKTEATGQAYTRNHKLEKNESAGVILNNKEDFFKILYEKFPQCKSFSTYKYNEFKIFYLYFEYGGKKPTAEEIKRYSNIQFIDGATLKYFVTMTKSIKSSFKYELFKFLGLTQRDIGKTNPYGNIKQIISPIIYPDSVTGFNDGIRMVSFMMRPIDLIENSYVLRKDGWEHDVDLYQRLITPKRIKEVRNFVAFNKTAFLNNIIVTLPQGVDFYRVNNDGSTNQVNIEDITKYDRSIEIRIPADFNSMAIIDGQHRVYAYYEDNEDNTTEKIVSKLRNELNLLVTGILYPNNDKYKDELEKRKFESNLFVSINKNAKAVDADTLIQVQAIMNPTSGEAISRKVIEYLNKEEPFENMFQLSQVEIAPIKTASIIQYALSSLLVAKNNETSLYHYWLLENNKAPDFTLRQSSDINSYIKYSVKCIRNYFKAIKSKFINYWNKESKLLMVISLNAFIIAYRDTLKDVGGPQEYDYYMKVFKDWDFNFNNSKDPENQFPYAGAQYSKFAKNEIVPLFKKQIALDTAITTDKD